MIISLSRIKHQSPVKVRFFKELFGESGHSVFKRECEEQQNDIERHQANWGLIEHGTIL